MGTDANETDKPKSSKRGSVNNEGRLKRLMGAKSQGTGKADWGGADPRWLQAVIVAVTSIGGAVSFGMSRDGGAHSLLILLDGERETLWFNGAADLDAELEQVYHMFESS